MKSLLSLFFATLLAARSTASLLHDLIDKTKAERSLETRGSETVEIDGFLCPATHYQLETMLYDCIPTDDYSIEALCGVYDAIVPCSHNLLQNCQGVPAVDNSRDEVANGLLDFEETCRDNGLL